MAGEFKKGNRIYFMFRHGYTVQDSQMKPRYYLSRDTAKKYLRCSGCEIVEYGPVMHGRWEITREHNDLIDMDVWKYTCSACHEYRLSSIPLSETMKFCPNCGARMDEGAEDEP